MQSNQLKLNDTDLKSFYMNYRLKPANPKMLTHESAGVPQKVPAGMNAPLISNKTLASVTTSNGVPLVGGVYDDHSHPHNDVTVAQMSMAIIWLVALTLWLIRVFFAYSNKPHNNDIDTNVPLKTSHSEKTPNNTAVIQMENNAEAKGIADDLKKPQTANSNKTQDGGGKPGPSGPSAPSLDEFLLAVIIIGVILFYFFLCDYRKIWPVGTKIYDRDTFLFLVFLLFLIGGAFTLKPTEDKILNRDQTEEWKGWMQVMFVWYHYWGAVEWYNWIRTYIAAYVWMTGFGNFSFFWVRKDYSPWRIMKMLFRLNFLVILVCAAVSNEYMLYYICIMHTYWFISVYLTMGIFKSWNTDRKKMAMKLAVYAICNAIIFDIPGMVEIVFKPLWFIFEFHDGKSGPLHEWAFRGGLDHWVCFVGMLSAYNYPYFETFLKKLENSEGDPRKAKRNLYVKVGIIGVLLMLLTGWYSVIMTKEKYDYNKWHPYTSAIPIISFIMLRNMFPVLRKYYIDMFAWLGKITLETYLSQLHIYLQSNARHIIEYIPEYTLLNFCLNTIIYLSISYILFNLTTQFSTFLLPKDYKVLTKNMVVVGLVIASATCVAHVTKFMQHF